MHMPNYEPTIGLEVHAILKTRTKMFCDSLNDPDEKRPNQNVCPVCMGHPGALPTINKEAVAHVLRAGLALGGAVNAVSKFDRKNYFYPDLPKGYQISQYDRPLVTGGELLGVRIRRIHLEEDAGRLLHESSGATLVDFNRAGTPLMELVTEPDMRSAAQAVEFAKELRSILEYLGVSDADMEKGLMRVEANVSLDMGAKVELKNINSFKAVGAAILYELARQREVLETGGAVEQETRGWDDAKQRTVSQRTKEEAHDYRYFPEPDLPPFEPPKVFDLEDMRAHLPELPEAKRVRFQREFNLSPKQAVQLAQQKPLADFFEAAASEFARREGPETADIGRKSRELLFNYLTSDLAGLMNELAVPWDALRVDPEALAHLVDLIANGKIGSRQAKDILKKMVETGDDPEEIMRSEGLETISDDAEVRRAVTEIIGENPKAAEDYRAGKQASVQFLIGKAMGKLRGRGDPERLKALFREGLERI